MYALLRNNQDESGMLFDICVLHNDDSHTQITNVGAVPPSSGQTVEGCLTDESRVKPCDGVDCETHSHSNKVMILSPPFSEEVRPLLSHASFEK